MGTVKVGIFLATLGVVLLAVELHVLSFYIFPVGVGLILAGLYLIFLKGIWGALLVFSVSSVLLYALSFKYVKGIKGFKNVVDELKNQKGIVIDSVDEFTYKVRFPLGAGGEEVWNAYSEERLNYGDRVEVIGVRGNKLVVKKVVDA